MPFSFAKRIEHGATIMQLYRHVLVRALMLIFLGMIYNDLMKFDWATMRYTSVLGHIGIAYFFAALIVLNANAVGQFISMVGLLIAYWAMMKFIPVPGYGAGDLSPGHTLNDYLDRMLMPGQLKFGDRDPLGILATIPAIGTALAGSEPAADLAELGVTHVLVEEQAGARDRVPDGTVILEGAGLTLVRLPESGTEAQSYLLEDGARAAVIVGDVLAAGVILAGLASVAVLGRRRMYALR